MPTLRLLITADLHYRPALRERYLAFADWVEAQEPDCFIVAGDVGHPLRLFERGLQLFSRLRCPKLLIAGNHDVYAGKTGEDAVDSRTLWEQLLPTAARKEGFHWLEADSYRLGATAICGTMAWYDYSARAGYLPFAPDEYRSIKRLVNHDADFIDWPWSDRAMARYLARGFTARLEQLEADPGVENIVVVTHMPIFPHALPDYPQSEIYSLQRAFLGNFTLGELVCRQRKVTHVVSGHLHREGRWEVQTAHRLVDFQVIGSTRGAPAATILELPLAHPIETEIR